MHAVLITLTPGRRNKLIHGEKTKVRIEVLPIMDIKTRWNSTLESLGQAYRSREFIYGWLQNPKFNNYWPMFTTQDQWTIVKYVMEVLRPFQYWTLWVLKRHKVTLLHVIAVYNDMFDHLDGMKRALAEKKSQWKDDLFVAVKLARQKPSKYYTEVTPMMGMLLISEHILDSFRKLRSFRKWDMGMDIIPEDETSYTTQYQQAFLKSVVNDYCAKHRCVPVNTLERLQSIKSIPFETASGSCQSSFDLYDLPSDNEECLTPYTAAETTPGRSNHAAHSLTATRLYLNSLPETPKNCWQINPNLIDYHSDPMESNKNILDTGHHRPVASTGENALKVYRSLQCGTWHILYHTTWC